jgi:hypothetical protein
MSSSRNVSQSPSLAPSASASVASGAITPEITTVRQFLLQYVQVENGRQKCMLCTKQHWAVGTSSTVISNHFEAKHRQVYQQRPGAAAPLSPHQTIQGCFTNQEVLSAFDDVVEVFIHHPGLPLSLAQSKHFRKVLKSPGRVTQAAVRQALKDKDRLYFYQFKAQLNGRKVGIQIDGGKNVNHNKVIGVCVVVERLSYCWDIVPVQDSTVLTETFYKELLLRVVRDIEACDAVVVSVTLDNEASPNAGVRELLASLSYLIHNRCYAHTAELVINDLQSTGTQRAQHAPAMPMLHDVVENVHKLVTAVLNNKYLRAGLEASQRDRAATPLKLVKHANTRKWSSSFLMLARFVKLYDDIATMDRFIAVEAATEAGERAAKVEWLLQKEQLMPHRSHCEAVRELLYWIYVGEQTVQRDGASVLHGTFVFEEICGALLSDAGANHRVPRIIQDNMNRDKVREIVEARRDLLKTSGIYHLSLVLWPQPLPIALDCHLEACTELETYVRKCWAQWQAKRHVMGLAQRYWCDTQNAQDMAAKLEQFITKAQEELTEHLVMPATPTVSRAKATFQTRSQVVAARLIAGERVVKRGRVDVDLDDDRDSVHVHGYWAAVTSCVPALALIARTLLACCATEAAVERLFSKEGFIHDSYRNRLGHDVLLALVRSCMNRHALHDEPLDVDSDASDDDA